MSAFQHPESPEDLAGLLASAAQARRTLQLEGLGTKRLLAGPVAPADVQVSTSGLAKVLQYEPKDLTIGVQAGLAIEQVALGVQHFEEGGGTGVVAPLREAGTLALGGQGLS